MTDTELKIQELVDKISNDEKYAGAIFESEGIYFTITDGKIRIISSYEDSSYKGGPQLDYVKGLPEAENKYIENLMKTLDFDEYFFNPIIEGYYEFSDEDAIDYFTEDIDYLDDDEAEERKKDFKLYKKIKKALKGKDSPFDSIDDFVGALELYGLDENRYYYKWEDEFFDLYENVQDCGEGRGTYEDYSDEQWIKILENIEKYKI